MGSGDETNVLGNCVDHKLCIGMADCACVWGSHVMQTGDQKLIGWPNKHITETSAQIKFDVHNAMYTRCSYTWCS